MHALSLIKDQQVVFHSYAAIIQDIRDLIALPWKVDLRHMLREGNQGADHLVKLGASTADKLYIFEDPLPKLRLILMGDAVGTAFPRGFPRLDPAP